MLEEWRRVDFPWQTTVNLFMYIVNYMLDKAKYMCYKVICFNINCGQVALFPKPDDTEDDRTEGGGEV